MNISEALATGRQVLSETESPDTDCPFLLCHLLQRDQTYLHTWPETSLTKEQEDTYLGYLKQRVKGHPIAHIIGRRGFWSLDVVVSSDTLIPRPDTELLVRLALDKITSNMLIADLGTGSGAIALALSSERSDVKVVASDASASALMVAQKNIALCDFSNISLWRGDWLSAIANNSLDMIISNPPYIESNDPHLMEGDVRFEPISALVSGHDGLRDIRVITQEAQRCLKPGSWLMIEHGYNQAKAVKAIFCQAELLKIETVKDYGENDRVTIGQQPL